MVYEIFLEEQIIDHKSLFNKSPKRAVIEALNNSKPKNRSDLILECKLIIDQIMCKGIDLVLMWIPSHTGIKGNDIVDVVAKQASKKSVLDNDIGFSIYEIYSKLEKTIKDKWKDQYRRESLIRNWNVFEVVENPKISSYLIPLFHRLRVRYYMNHYQKINCICKETLDYNHIFTCDLLIPQFNNLQDLLKKLDLNIQFSPKNLLNINSKYGWVITETFLNDLSKSEIGFFL